MKIDFSVPLHTLDGQKVQRQVASPDGSPTMVDWSAGEIAADAVLAPAPRGGELTAGQISERYALALRLHKGGVVDLTVSEANLIQQAAARTYAPLIAAQLIVLTEGGASKAA